MVQQISALSSPPPARVVPRHARLSERVWATLAELFRRAEPIELIEQRFSFLPRSFLWRGDLRRVRAVVRVWEQPKIGMRPARRYFEVICGQDGSYTLFQNLQIGTWHVSL
jgi:hypothetical protein